MSTAKNNDARPKKYYYISFIISLISLALFLNEGFFINAKTLITSSLISLLPFLIDSLTFLDDTKYVKKDFVFRILRGLNFFTSFLITLVIIVWVLVAMDILQTLSTENLTVLSFKSDGFFKILNTDFLYQLLCIKTLLNYHIVAFFIAMLVKFSSTHFYRTRYLNRERGDSTKK